MSGPACTINRVPEIAEGVLTIPLRRPRRAAAGVAPTAQKQVAMIDRTYRVTKCLLQLITLRELSAEPLEVWERDS
ncbi:hypothetical protein EVAR_97117_1 [Eumeta japonica]|uniref:Uncharacterized protein n=1 Tax=Eumeta variegata TaxID=151549 RepID=A0A4C1WQ50_EUMVA|nr:hypothetical protein EVAR_97117_1 [Eumeta japonica]